MTRVARAAPASVVVEIDGAAERVVDARSARRLVPLELSDVTVPPAGGSRGAAALFFRVLGREGSLRIELWDRGEYHGARTISSSGENPQLVARRVALAAAELVRRMARKREATLARDERLRHSREARIRAAAARTQDGPAALRSELALAAVPERLSLFGPRLSLELTLRSPLRLDIAAEHWGGTLAPRLRAELDGVSFGPSYRRALSSWLDLDLGARAAALLVRVPAALSIDAVPGEDSSWTARVDGALRFELRLSRQVRGTLGLEAGALLRSMSYASVERADRLRGGWLGASLGVVVTPR